VTLALICGGRDMLDRRAAFDALDAAHWLLELTGVVEGGQRTPGPDGRPIGGGDFWASLWARSHSLPCRTMRADWRRWGRAAGPIRNQQMLDENPIDVTLALPGSTGTLDMIQRSEASGILTLKIGPWRASQLLDR
jgi:hypothetical protein